MKPLMYKVERQAIEVILSELSERIVDRPLLALEWGSGGSTVYYTEYLLAKEKHFKWFSLEYDKVWYDIVTKELASREDSSVSVKLFDAGNTRLKQRKTNMDDYVSWPASTKSKYDFILVDGRKRRRCLLESKNLINPGGALVLHDAQREYYHSAFEEFPGGVFSSRRLWVYRRPL